MHGSASNINHFAGEDVDPVQQLLRALLLNRLLKLRMRNSWLQTQGDLRSRLGMSYIPALGLTTRFTDAAGGFIIGMNLHRELFMGKEKFQQQRKATRIR